MTSPSPGAVPLSSLTGRLVVGTAAADPAAALPVSIEPQAGTPSG